MSTTKVGHSIRVWNGYELIIPGNPIKSLVNMHIPDIWAEDSAQLYPIGTKLILHGGMGDRVFKYSQAGEALAATWRLCVCANHAPGSTSHENHEGFEGAPNAAGAAGTDTISFTDTSRAVDYYEGGHAMIYTTAFQQKGVIAGPSAAGTAVTITLEDPLDSAITTSTGITIYRSPFRNVKKGGFAAGYETAIGMNIYAITSGYYFWMQTDGPIGVTPTGGTWPGSASNLRSLAMNVDGTINPTSLLDPSSGYQIVGDLISATVSGYGDLWINMKLGQGG